MVEHWNYCILIAIIIAAYPINAYYIIKQQQQQHVPKGSILLTNIRRPSVGFINEQINSCFGSKNNNKNDRIYIPSKTIRKSKTTTTIYLTKKSQPELVILSSEKENIQNNNNTVVVVVSENFIMDRIVRNIGKSTSIVVSGIFFTVLVLKRDAFIISFFIGSIVNGILSKVLKKVINQSRPKELTNVDIIKLKPSDGGMPSSHAMSLGFIFTFLIMTVPITFVPAFLYGTISLYYRVQCKLHTWEQIIIGTIIGSFNGYIWYQFCTGRYDTTFNIIKWVTTTLLNEHGQLPYPMLIVPALIGAVTVGSVERRISRFIKGMKSN